MVLPYHLDTMKQATGVVALRYDDAMRARVAGWRPWVLSGDQSPVVSRLAAQVGDGAPGQRTRRGPSS